MLIPVRCFTCGKVTGNKYEKYIEYQQQGFTAAEALDKLGLFRICCRRILISHLDLTESLLEHQRKNSSAIVPPK